MPIVAAAVLLTSAHHDDDLSSDIRVAVLKFGVFFPPLGICAKYVLQTSMALLFAATKKEKKTIQIGKDMSVVLSHTVHHEM